MPRIEPLLPTQADEVTARTLKAVEAKLGMVPKLFSTFARAPAALNGYLMFSEALGKGRLSARQSEIVALAVAQANSCQYCLSAHTALGKGAGLSEREVLAARSGKAVDPIEQAVATLATSLVHQRGVISEAEFSSARAAGLDDGLILEVVAHVALNVLTNYTNHVAGTEIDFPTVDITIAA